MAATRTLVAVIAAFLAVSARASKYTREANEGLADAKRREAGEFRVVRLNQVWEKAQRVSGAARGAVARRRRGGPRRFGRLRRCAVGSGSCVATAPRYQAPARG